MKLTATGSFTIERLTALAASITAALVAMVAMHSGADLFDVTGAGLLAYILTVGGIAWKVPLTLSKVLSSTTKGALIGAVLTVIVVIGMLRSFKGLM
ncbi:hypothetical protein ACIOUE_35740 [Streptomyces xanthochromogenes]|uniref:hypothetical protein n=1 Tax=Streptomyces xanthochromogenes TaxID=67384 RepID=UPI00381804E5